MNKYEGMNYRQLALDSSNFLMEWDGQTVLGRHAEATRAVASAGAMRYRMGEMSMENGDLESAAEDWLSSAACYVEAGAVTEAVRSLQAVQQLEAQGAIPADRVDLFTALREREAQVEQLKAKTLNGQATTATAAPLAPVDRGSE